MSDEESYEYEYDDDEMEEGNNFEYTDDEEQGNDSEVALGKLLTCFLLLSLKQQNIFKNDADCVQNNQDDDFFNFNFSKVWQSW
jgi:hypothetical protein